MNGKRKKALTAGFDPSAEVSLSRQQKRFEALMRAHSAILWITDSKGAFVEPQPGWAAYTGQPWPEHKDFGGFEKIHLDDRERAWEVWSAAVKGASAYELEMRVWHAASQAWRWCAFRGEPVLDDSGNVIEWVGTMVDADARVKSEISLRESERRFRTILERVQSVGLILDTCGRIIFANDYLLNITGWNREEVIGKDYFDIFIQNSSDIRDRFVEAMRTGDIFAHAENDIVTRTGERRVIAWDNTVMRDVDGTVLGTASIGRDITEERDAVRRLQANEQKFRTLVETMPNLVWACQPDGYCNYLSTQWMEYTGQAEQEAKGIGWLQAVHSDDRPRIGRLWLEFLAGTAIYDTEYRLRGRDGEYRWFKARAAEVRSDSGEVLMILGTSTDIQSQKSAQDALRRSQENLRIALTASGTGTFRWDPNAGEFLEFGENLRLLFEFPPEPAAITTADFLARVHPDDRAEVERNVAKCREGADFDMEYRIVMPNGDIKWLYDRARMRRDANGVPVYLVGACTDITLRKRAEAILVRSEKLAAAGSLAATLAHEINNPLAALLNLIYLAKQPACTEEQRLSMLVAAEQEITRASELAKRSLRFYRGGSGDNYTDSLQRVLDSVLYVYGPKLSKHKVEIERRYIADGAVVVPESDLRQVFYNLVSNAVDAMPNGGRLLIKVSRSDNNEGMRLRVTIADTGKGIQPEVRQKLFKPFFTTKGDMGTGLGLWVSREIAERHNGNIQHRTSTSEQRHGTVFSVSFPAKMAGVAESAVGVA